MIKGVSKKIVEVNYTGDDYVEKAIFIINPKKSDLPEDILQDKAKEYLKKAVPKKRPSRRVKRRALCFAAALTLFVLTAVVLLCVL